VHSLEIFSTPWIFALCAVLFAAFVRGLAGFGFALILAPLLLLILDPIVVVIINLFLGLLSHIVVVLWSLREVNLRRISLMIASSLLGIPLGAWIISVIAPHIMKIVIGAVIICFAIPISVSFRKSFTSGKLTSGLAGFLSGILASSTSLGGPPVVLVMHSQNWTKRKILASLAAYFTFLNLFSLLALSISGQMHVEILVTAASLVPAMLIGVRLGMMVFYRTDSRLFRFLSMFIVICAGILAVISGLGILP